MFITTTWIIGIVVLMHFSVVKIAETSMRQLNQELSASASKDFTNMQRILMKRNRLVFITVDKINRNYGFLMLLIIGFILATGATGPFYLISRYSEELDGYPFWYYILIAINSYIWSSPTVTIFLAMYSCDGYNNEVLMDAKS
ncbi:gustatory and pheromone receptor 39a-like [Musca vetustissima]|uniref:gustatory and pheromone receptor 39a-like n=1 Tax=Musca vetustissima TaxID=27455 RepID=UPI002AB6C231|nr:gustatory and pheromone receptor 39a-like [Musca vetustissima]